MEDDFSYIYYSSFSVNWQENLCFTWNIRLLIQFTPPQKSGRCRACMSRRLALSGRKKLIWNDGQGYCCRFTNDRIWSSSLSVIGKIAFQFFLWSSAAKNRFDNFLRNRIESPFSIQSHLFIRAWRLHGPDGRMNCSGNDNSFVTTQPGLHSKCTDRMNCKWNVVFK